jgi:uncharacterized protein
VVRACTRRTSPLYSYAGDLVVRVPVTDLVGHPGATRAVVEDVAPADVDEHETWGPAEGAITAPLHVELDLESVVEGILVRGTVDVDLELPCARCLVPQRLEHTVPVAELFTDPRRADQDDEDDGYLIDDDLAHLDLGPLLRDTVVMEVPVRVLCRDDCQGLCPVCGQDRNEADCGHRPDEEPDPRWAALADVDVPPA